MQDHVRLQKVADSEGGDRFIILMEDADKCAAWSKPLTESEARTALDKMGNSAAVVEAMFDRAREVSTERATRGPVD